MPIGTTLRRSLLSAAALAALVMTQGAFAQFRDGEPALVEDAQSSAELAVDRRLAEQYAEQYAGPQPSTLPGGIPDAAPVALPATTGFDEAAAANLEKEIEAALAEAAAENEKQQPAKRTYVTAPNPWSTAGLIIGALALFALVSVVLTLAVRELRQDAKQRRRTYRRRVRRRETAAPATASAS